MRRLALLVMLISIGCSSDPHLTIEVQPPADPNGDYKKLVTKTKVTVYELDMLTCEQVEFGDVTEDLLFGAAVAEQTTFKPDGRTEGSLDDISRVGKKIIVARLYSANDTLIAAGCKEQGDIDGETKVVIQTLVAATVAVDPTIDEDPYGRQITVVDPLGDSLAGHEVRWRMFAPAGATPSATVIPNATDSTIWDSATPACTTNTGIARMRLTTPAKVSGFAARFRVSWPANRIDVISGFVRAGAGVQLLSGAPKNPCAIRTVGERRVVCATEIVPNSGVIHARKFELVQLPNKNYNIIDRGGMPIGARPAGMFTIDEAGGKEAYALMPNATVWSLSGSQTTQTCTDCTIDDFRVAPPCGDDGARLIMHSTTGTPLRTMDKAGGAVMDFRVSADIDPTKFNITLNAAGCVTTISPTGVEKDVQIVLLDLESILNGGTTTRGVFRCGATTCGVTLPFPDAGVGFLKAGTATKPEMQMVGTSFDFNGAELVGWVLRPTLDGATFLLIDRQRIVAAAPPASIAIGKLDADSEPDMVWTMKGSRSSILQVSYAKTIEDGSRLSALAPSSAAVEQLLLAELTGDAFDDLIGVAAGAFIAIPQNVDGPPVMARTQDSPCGQ